MSVDRCLCFFQRFIDVLHIVDVKLLTATFFNRTDWQSNFWGNKNVQISAGGNISAGIRCCRWKENVDKNSAVETRLPCHRITDHGVALYR